jgi:hypothetical protein
MAPLNEDGRGISFARDLIEKITDRDRRIKELSDVLSLEGHYIEDAGFSAAYLADLNAVIAAQEGEVSRLETIARALHAA